MKSLDSFFYLGKLGELVGLPSVCPGLEVLTWEFGQLDGGDVPPVEIVISNLSIGRVDNNYLDSSLLAALADLTEM